ncbi:prolipoprotein diacylglyceryl transferase [Alginatibacterium sediminis]|uniref:Phosphatidylglycerol--prolipoprotein diacylglyceryl transferase n=1 Tax=Alginatibacterium sediminis TaxID=2164068 RepID=A0A420EJR8_9ALTE|nr:prolipoprotein diacylglyceryl transferase [Alginatibacterium sediminis]
MIAFPQIDPIIFSIGPVAVRWYGLMYLFGFIFAYWLANRMADKKDSGWTREEVSDVLFYGFVGVVAGGRIGYVLFYQTAYFLTNPLYLFEIWSGGMSFHGGLLGVIAALWWFARKTNRKFFQVSDFIAPLVPFGLATGRLGNFINAELWGRTTDMPWGIVFPGGGALPRHPSQLYEFFLEGIVLLVILLLYRRKNPPMGAVSGLFLLGYGGFRFIVEFFREPDAHLGVLNVGLTMGQVLSTPMIIIGAWFMLRAYQKAKS